MRVRSSFAADFAGLPLHLAELQGANYNSSGGSVFCLPRIAAGAAVICAVMDIRRFAAGDAPSSFSAVDDAHGCFPFDKKHYTKDVGLKSSGLYKKSYRLKSLMVIRCYAGRIG